MSNRSDIPNTQYAVQLVGPGELRLNTEKPVPLPGPRQVLARTEAVGLCFSDLKLLKQFQEHVRKGEIVSGVDPGILAALPSYVPGMQPTVPGHEVALRIVAVGEGVTEYAPGQRWILQPDFRTVRTAGSNAAVGYNLEGALQEYVLLDERLLRDATRDECYMLPVAESLGAASAALVEPWACVECSYATPERRHIKAKGRLLVAADPGVSIAGLGVAFAPEGPPASLTTFVPDSKQREALLALGLASHDITDPGDLPDEGFDDIVYFGASRQTLEVLNDKVAAGGIINVVLGGRRIGEPVSVGLGRIHYGPVRWIGTTGNSAAESYAMIPDTGEIRPNDRIVIMGAGGPMGQMHTIRALMSGVPGITVFAVDRDQARLEALSAKALPMAEAGEVPYHTINAEREPVPGGFTYYALMAPIATLAAEAVERAAKGAIINIFAGIPAPVRHEIALDALIEKRVFMFGTSGSETEHMRIVLEKVTEGRLSTEASVDAVSGMAGATDGLAAVENRTLAGKIIVYPQLRNVPLIPLERMADHYPTVAAKMTAGRWTREAEQELLEVATR